VKAPNTDQLMSILREAAKTEILPRFRRLTPDMVRMKSNPTDLVTEADELAERLIHARVRELAPDALFIGEEAVSANPDLLKALAGADVAVIVDPVDGTGNFAAGLPLFAVMASVVVKGEAVTGIIYDPMADDFVVAEKGSGAFTRTPDGASIRLKVKAPVPLGEMVGTASVANLPASIKSAIMANLAKVRIASAYRCAGHEYRMFAGGHTHFAMFRGLMPWDHVAGALIAAEAGAHVARLDGTPYRPEHNEGGLLMAVDRDSWEVLRREVFAL
jgi:fructose-1,6-bisphosphatase/inositol monophosphatase family enzyme